MGLFRNIFNPIISPPPKTTNGEPLDISLITSPFNLKTIKERPEGKYYLLDSDNTKIALKFLPVLNDLIKQAKRIHKSIPGRKFSDGQFEKQSIKIDYVDSYTIQLAFNPLTKTKRDISKCPISLYYYPNGKLFANVDLNKEGEIEKAEITVWGDLCYILKASRKNGQLTIISIYENDFGYRTKVYPQ